MGAVAGVAGGTGDVEADDGFGAVVGAGADGVGGAEEGDQGFVEGGGDVHGTGIVGDDERGAVKEGDELRQVCFAGEYLGSRVCAAWRRARPLG